MNIRKIATLLTTAAFASVLGAEVLGAEAQAFEATDTSAPPKPELRAISVELICHQLVSDLVKQTPGQRCTATNGSVSVQAGSQITNMGGASVLAGNGGFTYQATRACTDKNVSAKVTITAGGTAKVGGVSIKAGAEVKCDGSQSLSVEPKR